MQLVGHLRDWVLLETLAWGREHAQRPLIGELGAVAHCHEVFFQFPVRLMDHEAYRLLVSEPGSLALELLFSLYKCHSVGLLYLLLECHVDNCLLICAEGRATQAAAPSWRVEKVSEALDAVKVVAMGEHWLRGELVTNWALILICLGFFYHQVFNWLS